MNVIRVHTIDANRTVTRTDTRYASDADEMSSLRRIAFSRMMDRTVVTVNGQYVPVSRDWWILDAGMNAEIIRGEDDDACEGHESLNGADMGKSVYCNGRCR